MKTKNVLAAALAVVLAMFVNVAMSRAQDSNLVSLYNPIPQQPAVTTPACALYESVVGLIGSLTAGPSTSAAQRQTGNDSGGNPTLAAVIDLSAEILTNDPSDLWQILPENINRLLVGSLTTAKLQKLVAGSANPGREGVVLTLLWETRQSMVPAFLSDSGLRGRVGKNGQGLILAEDHFFSHQDAKVSQDLLVLEQYRPSEAVGILVLASQNWDTGGEAIYRQQFATWGSAGGYNLQKIYQAIRLSEIVQRSTAAKLLVWSGKLEVPTVAYTSYWDQDWPSVSVAIPPVVWSARDTARANILASGNGPFASLAQAKLAELGAHP